MANSESSPFSGDICICIEGLSARNPQQRERAAKELSELSVHMRPLERMAAMKALERMVEDGDSVSDFVFGVYAYGEVASGMLPLSAPNQKPPSRSDAVSTVIRLCGLEWAEKLRGREQVVRAGLRAIQSIRGEEPALSICGPILDAIRSGNISQKILALQSALVLDLREEEVVLAAAKATFDPEHSVCLAAEEAFRKISRYGHPLRGIILEGKEPLLRRAIAGYLQDASGPEITFLGRMAIHGFFSENIKARIIVEELVERGLLKQKDVDGECGICPHASSRKMGDLHRMVSQRAHLSRMLELPDGIPSGHKPVRSFPPRGGGRATDFPKRKDTLVQRAYHLIVPPKVPFRA